MIRLIPFYGFGGVYGIAVASLFVYIVNAYTDAGIQIVIDIDAAGTSGLFI